MRISTVFCASCVSTCVLTSAIAQNTIVNTESNVTNVAVGSGSSVNSGINIGGSSVNQAVVGNGKTAVKEIKLENFSVVEADGAFEIQINVGKTSSIQIKSDENIIPLVSAAISSGTLKIGLTKSITVSKPIVLVIEAPAKFAGVTLGGACSGIVKGIAADVFSVALNGSANLTASGTANSLQSTLNGSNRLESKDLKIKDASVSITGAGDAVVNATASLKVSITGSGSVDYYGNPPKIDKQIVGVGSVTAK